MFENESANRQLFVKEIELVKRLKKLRRTLATYRKKFKTNVNKFQGTVKNALYRQTGSAVSLKQTVMNLLIVIGAIKIPFKYFPYVAGNSKPEP